MIVSAE